MKTQSIKAFEVIEKKTGRVVIVRRDLATAQNDAADGFKTVRETTYRGTGDGYFDVMREEIVY